MSDSIVAALCYRRRGARAEFLLVHTKGGKTWTFPKGHVKKRERPQAAAAREAREEAGAVGRVSSAPVGRYRYPATRRGDPEDDHAVEAYLLEVESQRPTDESFRTPTWFTAAEARRRLAEGREKKYVEEHEHILAAALDALKSPAKAKP